MGRFARSGPAALAQRAPHALVPRPWLRNVGSNIGDPASITLAPSGRDPKEPPKEGEGFRSLEQTHNKRPQFEPRSESRLTEPGGARLTPLLIATLALAG